MKCVYMVAATAAFMGDNYHRICKISLFYLPDFLNYIAGSIFAIILCFIVDKRALKKSEKETFIIERTLYNTIISQRLLKKKLQSWTTL